MQAYSLPAELPGKPLLGQEGLGEAEDPESGTKGGIPVPYLGNPDATLSDEDGHRCLKVSNEHKFSHVLTNRLNRFGGSMGVTRVGHDLVTKQKIEGSLWTRHCVGCKCLPLRQ